MQAKKDMNDKLEMRNKKWLQESKQPKRQSLRAQTKTDGKSRIEKPKRNKEEERKKVVKKAKSTYNKAGTKDVPTLVDGAKSKNVTRRTKKQRQDLKGKDCNQDKTTTKDTKQENKEHQDPQEIENDSDKVTGGTIAEDQQANKVIIILPLSE